MSIRVMMTFGLTGFRLPSIQRSLDRLISGQSLNPFLIFRNFGEVMGPSPLSLCYPSPEFLGVPFRWFACMTFQIALGRLPSMAFITVQLWRWLLSKSVRVKIAGSFPTTFWMHCILGNMSAWLSFYECSQFCSFQYFGWWYSKQSILWPVACNSRCLANNFPVLSDFLLLRDLYTSLCLCLPRFYRWYIVSALTPLGPFLCWRRYLSNIGY